jgi:sortase, SrtB family
VVGWIAAEGTEIDYPVVQGDNNDFYLDHLFTGERNKLGSIFMDCRNDAGFADKNTILYGHNMKDGSMFSSLTKYKDQRYYDRHPAMLLHTPEGSYRIELFAGIVVDGDDESVRMTFRDDDDFLDYVGSLRQASTFVSDTAVGADDRIVTLCTCSYEFNNARFALFGKLTPLA